MLPSLQPVELWQKSGRDKAMGQTLFHLTDRHERELVLGPTHEEVVVDLFRATCRATATCPSRSTRYRPSSATSRAPAAASCGVREFTMKDAYSFDADEEGLDVSYNKMVQAYKNIYDRCGLPAMMVEADSGAIGGKDSHEFMASPRSARTRSSSAPAAATRPTWRRRSSRSASREAEAPLPMEEVATPGQEDHRGRGRLPRTSRPADAQGRLLHRRRRAVFVVIRGDLEVNEIKLRNVLAPPTCHLMDAARSTRPGSCRARLARRPEGRPRRRRRLGRPAANFVAGANKPDTHLQNVNYPRDFKADIVADIAHARAGDACPTCGAALVRRAASRWATSSSWAPSTARSWAPTSWTRTARRSPLSWAATASASGG